MTDEPTALDALRVRLAEMGHHPESSTPEYKLFTTYLDGATGYYVMACEVCRAPAEGPGSGCVCVWLLADALQKYLRLDFDLSAKVAADLQAEYGGSDS